MPDGCLVLVPLRSFADPKTRLAEVLTLDERTTLTTTLAAGVLDALAAWDVAVVTDDPAVVDWCSDRDTAVIAPGVTGLNAAVAAAVDEAASTGRARVAVVHADLAHPGALDEVLGVATTAPDDTRVVAVADRHGDGTNVLVVPTGTGFRFAYGPGSFSRHRAEAIRLGLEFVEATSGQLGWDVDTPDDLARYRPEPA